MCMASLQFYFMDNAEDTEPRKFFCTSLPCGHF